MPVRLATRADMPVMAQVYVASFGPDRLFKVFFPRMDEYPDDFLRAAEEHLWLTWYDYSKIILLSYRRGPQTPGGEQTPLLASGNKNDDDADADADADKNNQQVITGISVWGRNGSGWENVHGTWGRWDPRLLIRPILETFYTIRRFFYPNKAAVTPTPESPEPLTFWNFMSKVVPFARDFYSAPHRQNNFWSLETMAVHPSYQGQGYGRELVESGLDLVKNDPSGELPADVVAADGKEAFYQKCGFRDLVGFICETVDDKGRDNPLRSNGVGGGAVLWTK
ncbi:hypothetical protein PV08_11109 [Exophiala spinifera]|uniref:N-acetyltransferase domain-containing protein n=1 Tax=Exophiala spinifera TaxID=91928 RepID=A0A0D2ATT7_9EURO|nr:uncharacterized protein PV08_11109 [Exophiala spinifera]KIW10148.1 hypothetical protein PV08_11109 [Exophiala spinifera]